jgi:hypothetical protein
MLYYDVSCTSTMQVDCTKIMKGSADKNKINPVSLFCNVSIVNNSLTAFELKLYTLCFNIWNLCIIPTYYTFFLWFSLGREIISLSNIKKFSFVMEQKVHCEEGMHLYIIFTSGFTGAFVSFTSILFVCPLKPKFLPNNIRNWAPTSEKCKSINYKYLAAGGD